MPSRSANARFAQVIRPENSAPTNGIMAVSSNWASIRAWVVPADTVPVAHATLEAGLSSSFCPQAEGTPAPIASLEG